MNKWDEAALWSLASVVISTAIIVAGTCGSYWMATHEILLEAIALFWGVCGSYWLAIHEIPLETIALFWGAAVFVVGTVMFRYVLR